MRLWERLRRAIGRRGTDEDRAGTAGTAGVAGTAGRQAPRSGDPSVRAPVSGERERAPSRVVVGLGNPGAQYAATRHNAGFRVLDCLAARRDAVWQDDVGLSARVAEIEIDGRPLLLAQPTTFMNRSGESMARVLERWPELMPESDLLIVCDDLDLRLGRIRLRPAGGSGGHRGLADIFDRLGTKMVPRLRFGIGHPGRAAKVIDWVLQPFDAQEEHELLPVMLDQAADAIEAVSREGVEVAMGRFNAERPVSSSSQTMSSSRTPGEAPD